MKKIHYVVLMGLLLVACTTKNEPSLTKGQIAYSQMRSSIAPIDSTAAAEPIDPSEESIDAAVFENMYNDVYSLATELLSNDEIWTDLRERYNTVYDIAYDDVVSYVESQDIEGTSLSDYIAYRIEEIANRHEVYVDWSDINTDVMSSYITRMLDSVYVTPRHRHEVYDDSLLNVNEKFALTIAYAFKNYAYLNDRTQQLLVKDSYSRYLLTSVPEDIPFRGEFFVVTVDDLGQYDIEEIGGCLKGTIPYTDMYLYQFGTYAEKKDFIDQLGDTHFYYVTAEECKEERDARIDELETNLAYGCALSAFAGFETFGTVCLSAAFIYTVVRIAIEIEYRNCLKEADKEENNNK